MEKYNVLMEIVKSQRSTMVMLDSLKDIAYEEKDYISVDTVQKIIDRTYEDLKVTEQILSDVLGIGNPLLTSNQDYKLEQEQPTVILPDGAKFWYNKNKKLHRDGDLPAIIYADGSQEWYKNGQRYRCSWL